MPTYKLGSEVPPHRQRPLTCERCGAVLGYVQTVSAYSQLPARLVLKNWPELAEGVRRHEEECPQA